MTHLEWTHSFRMVQGDICWILVPLFLSAPTFWEHVGNPGWAVPLGFKVLPQQKENMDGLLFPKAVCMLSWLDAFQANQNLLWGSLPSMRSDRGREVGGYCCHVSYWTYNWKKAAEDWMKASDPGHFPRGSASLWLSIKICIVKFSNLSLWG